MSYNSLTSAIKDAIKSMARTYNKFNEKKDLASLFEANITTLQKIAYADGLLENARLFCNGMKEFELLENAFIIAYYEYKDIDLEITWSIYEKLKK